MTRFFPLATALSVALLLACGLFQGDRIHLEELNTHSISNLEKFGVR